MIAIFLLGTVFGALLMFMARIMDYHAETIIERYRDNGSVFRRKPIILKPDADDFEDEQPIEEE